MAFYVFITPMKRLRWQILVILLTMGVVGVLLIAQEPGQTLFVPQPTTGGVYTEGLVGAMTRLNPLLDTGNPADRDVNRLIFSGLVRFDDRGLPLPDLAESWGTSLDGTTYNFSIRPTAVWHDGQPVTSQDVVFTIDLIRGGASFFPQDVVALWQSIEVKVLNAQTVQFILPEPFAPFLDYLTFGVLPAHLLSSVAPAELPTAEFNLRPVGSGPYKFDSLVIENGQIAGIVLTPFDQYYGQKPFIEQIVLRYYATAEAAYGAYRQGEVLAISQVTNDILPAALSEPNLSLYSSRLPQLGMVMLNLKDPETPFLQEAAVRRAMLLGLNRQYMINTLLQGQGIVADGPIFPGTWAYFEGIEHLDYNPEAAIELLKGAGYVIPASGGQVRFKDNTALRLTMLHPDTPYHAAVAAQIQSDWARIGLEVSLQAQPYADLVNNRLAARSYQAALVEINLARTPDPDPYPFWHQSEITGGQNYSQWENRTASEYLEQARITPNITDRTRLYRNFQVLFAKELPSLPLFYPIYTFGVDSQVLGVQVPPMFDSSDRFSGISQWYLVTRRALQGTAEPATQP